MNHSGNTNQCEQNSQVKRQRSKSHCLMHNLSNTLRAWSRNHHKNMTRTRKSPSLYPVAKEQDWCAPGKHELTAKTEPLSGNHTHTWRKTKRNLPLLRQKDRAEKSQPGRRAEDQNRRQGWAAAQQQQVIAGKRETEGAEGKPEGFFSACEREHLVATKTWSQTN
jgi:hypothetical protein